MTCIRCQHQGAKKFGTYGKRRIQRWRCRNCNSTFADPSAPKPLGSHYTTSEVAAKALTLMLEGMSVRAISRITGLHKHTVLSLMTTAAEKARRLLDSQVRNIRPGFVQLDELWGFVHSKDAALGPKDPNEWGSAYVWLALDSETKLILSHHIGARNGINAYAFIRDLSSRTVGRFQITTDALRGYIGAIEEFYGGDVDYAQLHKIYGRIEAGPDWYGSGRVVGAVPRVQTGNPDYRRISTSHIERANLSIRMHLRRFTRMTNAFSKKLDNLKAAVTLYVAFYNFCRVHLTLRVTPAMEAGLTNHVWTVDELLAFGV
jgi:transposase-like protein/IS1 family transposase